MLAPAAPESGQESGQGEEAQPIPSEVDMDTCTEDSFMMESDPDAVTTADVTLATPEDSDDVLMEQNTVNNMISHDHTYCEKNLHTCDDHTDSEQTINTGASADLNQVDAAIISDEMGVVNEEKVIDQSQELFSPEVISIVGVGSDVGVPILPLDMMASSAVEDSAMETTIELVPDMNVQECTFVKPIQSDHQNSEPNFPSHMVPDPVSSNNCGNVNSGSYVSSDQCERDPILKTSLETNVNHTPSEHNGCGSNVDHTSKSPSMVEELLCHMDDIGERSLTLDKQGMCKMMESHLKHISTLVSKIAATQM